MRFDVGMAGTMVVGVDVVVCLIGLNAGSERKEGVKDKPKDFRPEVIKNGIAFY